MKNWDWNLWQLATENRELILWHIKKDKALHETGATRTRSGLALRLSAGSWCQAARSSSASAPHGGSPDSTSDAPKPTLSSPTTRDASTSSTTDPLRHSG